jgi:hypothetical protein
VHDGRRLHPPAPPELGFRGGAPGRRGVTPRRPGLLGSHQGSAEVPGIEVVPSRGQALSRQVVIVIAIKGRRFKMERVRQGIPVLIGLIILTIVRVMVNH